MGGAKRLGLKIEAKRLGGKRLGGKRLGGETSCYRVADIRASVNIDEASFQTVVKVVQKTMSVLRESAEACISREKYSKRTVSLNVWNDDISASLRRKKVAYKA